MITTMAVYTPLDYLIGLLILLVIMLGAYRFIFRLVDFDKYFLYTTIPMIIFTISVRVLADANVYEKNELWSVTPGVYVLGTLFGIVIIALGKIIESAIGTPYWKGALLFGTPPALYFAVKLLKEMREPLQIFQPYLLALIITAVIYYLSGRWEPARIFREKSNILIIFGHMLDASATFIGIDFYNFSEEHILPEFLIQKAGTAAVMIPLKMIVVLGALYYIEKWQQEEGGSDLYYRMVKFLFFIFGFGPGTRDSLLLGL